MPAPYESQAVANYFLDRAAAENRPVSPLKLLKLVYIGFGWVKALTDQDLFSEDIEAWQHGPVVVSLYHEFKDFRSSPITERSGVFDLESSRYTEPEIPQEDEDINLILDRVWVSYREFSGWALRDKTHEPDTPWSNVYERGQNNVIPPDQIGLHFQERIARYLNAA